MNLKDKILLLQQGDNVYLNLEGDNIYYETNGFIKNVFDYRMKIDETLNLNKVTSNKLRLGAIGELYAQYIMTSFGYDVFPSIVDDHGIDLIAVKDNHKLKIQVKTVNVGTYVYFPKEKFDKIMGGDYLIIYIRVDKDGKPTCFLYPSNIWKNVNEESDWSNEQFVFHSYTNKRSKPEYGIYGSEKYYNKPSYYCIGTDDDWKFNKEQFETILNDYNN